jgi:hypothetical protein
MGAKTRRHVCAPALAAAILLGAHSTSSAAGCSIFNATADGWNKEEASGAAVAALNAVIETWKASNGVTGAVKKTAEKPQPHPYWRSAVSPELFLTPDVVTDSTYTTCWRGVVSKVVCTSGAKVCG